MSYVEEVYQNLVAKHPYEPEFLEAAKRVLDSLEPIVSANEELYRKNTLLERLVEPERIITFRVPWVDDNGKQQLNLGYRVQFNSAIGPYKGGLRFHPTVNQSILKFLGFEQIFKNSLVDIAAEAKASLVGSDRGVELHTIAEVYVVDTVIIGPRDTERDNALRLDQSLEERSLAVRRLMCRDGGLDRLENALCGLEELGLIRVFCHQAFIHFFYVRHHCLLIYGIVKTVESETNTNAIIEAENVQDKKKQNKNGIPVGKTNEIPFMRSIGYE